VFVSFATGIIHGHPTASVEKRRELLAELLAGSRVSLVLMNVLRRTARSSTVKPASWAVKASCQSGLVPPTGPVASPHWIKVKNPSVPAAKREAEEDWGR
jgi:hypothetical protein